MRKITESSVKAFLNNQTFSRENMRVNTTYHAVPGGVSLRQTLFLHNNAIARYTAEGVLEITTADWNTPTTRARLNGLPGVRVHVAKGVLYLNGKEWDGAWTAISNA